MNSEKRRDVEARVHPILAGITVSGRPVDEDGDALLGKNKNEDRPLRRFILRAVKYSGEVSDVRNDNSCVSFDSFYLNRLIAELFNACSFDAELTHLRTTRRLF